MSQIMSPWLNGIPAAAKYAHMRESRMRKLVKSEAVVSRRKPKDEDGNVPRGVLVFAPSIDEYLMGQPSGATSISQALHSTS